MILLGYSRFYDSLNSMLPSDRPEDAIIEDDAALDKWYEAYLREQAVKYGRKSNQSETLAQFRVPEFKAGNA
jgi:hypothetical protein